MGTALAPAVWDIPLRVLGPLNVLLSSVFYEGGKVGSQGSWRSIFLQMASKSGKPPPTPPSPTSGQYILISGSGYTGSSILGYLASGWGHKESTPPIPSPDISGKGHPYQFIERRGGPLLEGCPGTPKGRHVRSAQSIPFPERRLHMVPSSKPNPPVWGCFRLPL